jgi:hypothetical protein
VKLIIENWNKFLNENEAMSFTSEQAGEVLRIVQKYMAKSEDRDNDYFLDPDYYDSLRSFEYSLKSIVKDDNLDEETIYHTLVTIKNMAREDAAGKTTLGLEEKEKKFLDSLPDPVKSQALIDTEKQRKEKSDATLAGIFGDIESKLKGT